MRAASLIAAFITGTIFTSFIVVAWTGPTAPPPAGNIAPPLNAGSVDQIKDAGLGVNSLAVFGNAIISGTTRYLNFGTLPLEDGFGIRNNDGTLEFKNDGGSWSSVATANSITTSIQNFFSSSSSNTVEEINFADGTTQTTAGGDTIPTGAIMAFDLTTCPSGWSEYTQARGRFLRGIDNGAANDPDGTRAPGSIQQDAFQGHEHFDASQVSFIGYSGVGVQSGTGWPRNQYENSAGIYSAGYGTPRISTETRPDNVAVLFCRKN